MNLFQDKKNEYENSVLSATRPKETILKTGFETQIQLQTRLKQKSIIKIYVDENKYYVEHSVAYALGLIKTRAIMMDKPKLIEMPIEIHNRLKFDDTIEMEYEKIEKKNDKQSLKVYVDCSQYCIDNSAAYALGFLKVEQFNGVDGNYYYISEDMLNSLKGKFNIEYYSLNLEQYSSNKKL